MFKKVPLPLVLIVSLFSVSLGTSVFAGTAGMKFVASGNYNLRTGPGLDRKKIGLVPKGHNIEVISCYQYWCHVKAAGITAYVHKNALTTKEELEAYENVPVMKNAGSLNFGSPVCDCKGTRGRPGCYLTSGFGPRKSRRTTNGRRMSSNHPGWDIGSSRRAAAVVAVESGYIRNVTSSVRYGYGRSLEINHGKSSNGKTYTTKYSHLSRIVKSSGWVNKGEVIGYTGATGNVTGIHLDIIFRVNGVATNPNRFLSRDPKWLSQSCKTAREEGKRTSGYATGVSR